MHKLMMTAMVNNSFQISMANNNIPKQWLETGREYEEIPVTRNS